MTRRRALVAGSALLVPTLAGAPALAKTGDGTIPKVPADGRAHNVVLTGANSGIGLDAAIKMAAGGYTVHLVCRNLDKAKAAKAEVEKAVAALGGDYEPVVVPMACDLSSLESVRDFAKQWKLLGKTLDVLVLNAGVALSTTEKFSGPAVPRTQDGFELTVGTNHLAHFLLVNLLLPELERAPGAPRLVVTASQVHDPASAGGSQGSKATLGDLKGLAAGGAWEMVDGGLWDGDKAYKDSKLCNVLFTRELARRLKAKGSKVSVNCFSPGLITRTGLFRNQNSVFVKVFDFIVYNVARVAETVSFGGDTLVTMATGKELDGKSGVFWANSKPGQHTFEEVAVSKEAANDEEAARLWALSTAAVGLTETI